MNRARELTAGLLRKARGNAHIDEEIALDRTWLKRCIEQVLAWAETETRP